MSALSDSTNTVSTGEQVDVPEKTNTVQEEVAEQLPASENVASENATSEETPAEEKVEVTEEEQKVELQNKMSGGRRCMKTGEYVKAVELLSSAAEISASLFGDFAVELFEPYFLYGQALFEVAKMEQQVLDNAMTNMPKEEEASEPVDENIYENPDKLSEEAREDIKQKVEDAMAEGSGAETVEEKTEEAVEEKAEDVAEDKPEDVVEDKPEDVAEQEPAAEETETEGEAENKAEEEGAEEGESDEEQEDEEETDTLKQAWEVLEVARKICENQLNLENADAASKQHWTLKMAEVYEPLAEVQSANGMNENAIKDLQHALEMQEQHVSAGKRARVLASTHHTLAKAYRSDNDFVNAKLHFEKSKSFIDEKIEELALALEAASEEAKKEIESELKELRDVVTDVASVLEDAKQSAVEAEKAKEDIKKQLADAVGLLQSISEVDTPANDISGMIRRPAKRPASEEPVAEEAVTKKAKEETKEAATNEAVPSDPAPAEEASKTEAVTEVENVEMAEATDVEATTTETSSEATSETTTPTPDAAEQAEAAPSAVEAQ